MTKLKAAAVVVTVWVVVPNGKHSDPELAPKMKGVRAEEVVVSGVASLAAVKPGAARNEKHAWVVVVGVANGVEVVIELGNAPKANRGIDKLVVVVDPKAAATLKEKVWYSY